MTTKVGTMTRWRPLRAETNGAFIQSAQGHAIGLDMIPREQIFQGVNLKTERSKQVQGVDQ